MSPAEAAATGYVRVPRAWISLEVSPGAKALLLHLCAAANAAGESWYKYRALGAIIGRSKAAVSGYVGELVEAGLIETERQRTANGYNAHLLIRLVGWSDILHAWTDMGARRTRESGSGAGSATRKTAREGAAATAAGGRSAERRVRPVERMDPSGPNKNHFTDSAADATATGWSETDEDRWRRAEAGAAGFDFDRPPERDLLEKAIATHAALRAAVGAADRGALEAAARQAVEGFVARRRLVAETDEIAAAAAVIADHGRTEAGVSRAIDVIEAGWAPHWRRLSTPGQLRAALGAPEARKTILGEAERRLWRFATRALMARRELDRRRRDPFPRRRHSRSDVSDGVIEPGDGAHGESPVCGISADRRLDAAEDRF